MEIKDFSLQNIESFSNRYFKEFYDPYYIELLNKQDLKSLISWFKDEKIQEAIYNNNDPFHKFFSIKYTSILKPCLKSNKTLFLDQDNIDYIFSLFVYHLDDLKSDDKELELTLKRLLNMSIDLNGYEELNFLSDISKKSKGSPVNFYSYSFVLLMLIKNLFSNINQITIGMMDCFSKFTDEIINVKEELFYIDLFSNYLIIFNLIIRTSSIVSFKIIFIDFSYSFIQDHIFNLVRYGEVNHLFNDDHKSYLSLLTILTQCIIGHKIELEINDLSDNSNNIILWLYLINNSLKGRKLSVKSITICIDFLNLRYNSTMFFEKLCDFNRYNAVSKSYFKLTFTDDSKLYLDHDALEYVKEFKEGFNSFFYCILSTSNENNSITLKIPFFKNLFLDNPSANYSLYSFAVGSLFDNFDIRSILFNCQELFLHSLDTDSFDHLINRLEELTKCREFFFNLKVLNLKINDTSNTVKLDKCLYRFFLCLDKDKHEYFIDLRKLKMLIETRTITVLNKDLAKFYISILSGLDNFSEFNLFNVRQENKSDWLSAKMSFDYKNSSDYKKRNTDVSMVLDKNIGYYLENNIKRKILNHEIIALIFSLKRIKRGKGVLKKNVLNLIQTYFYLEKSTKTYYIEMILF